MKTKLLILNICMSCLSILGDSLNESMDETIARIVEGANDPINYSGIDNSGLLKSHYTISGDRIGIYIVNCSTNDIMIDLTDGRLFYAMKFIRRNFGIDYDVPPLSPDPHSLSKLTVLHGISGKGPEPFVSHNNFAYFTVPLPDECEKVIDLMVEVLCVNLCNLRSCSATELEEMFYSHKIKILSRPFAVKMQNEEKTEGY
jgi:hypothetical protein